ncbi:MAG: SurA N-terminal domain-containing protein [Bacteroidales bacterium]|nr:SurA N-terminal domain-containing protein [Bacteroidales bacterium]MBN2821373.1 SurA N-terminal domain-containing protein [Bacteroidales bacterium]
MAIIQKIRNRAGLLVALIIGMALVAFILGDFLTSGGIYFSNQRSNIAEINGKGIKFQEFQSYLDNIEEITKAQRGVNSLDEQSVQEVRESAWQSLIREQVMNREYSLLGLSVHSDELFDLISGENPHPTIKQYFTDPNTGVLNRFAIQQYLSQMSQIESDNPQKQSWLYLEDMIYNDRLMTKYNNLLRKGLYATKVDVEKRKNNYNKTVDFSFIVKRYTEIADTAITVNEADLKAYYKAHEQEFEQEESRDIRYIVWEVVPSQEDVKSAEKWINEVAVELKEIDAENAFQYVKANSDLAPTTKNFSPGELPFDIDAWAFNAELGDVYGPYQEGDFYKLAKLAQISYLPDSVRASHILLRINQQDYMQKQALADSLVDLLKSGKASFEALASEYSTDGTAEKGGDLDWFKEGDMVQPFSDSCFMSKKGDIKQAITQFGLHIIKITDQAKPTKKVKLAVLSREIRPSESTDQLYYSQASQFGSKNTTKEKFDAAVNEGTFNLRQQNNLTALTANISGIPHSRELVQWAYQAKAGDVTPRVYEFENKYVVAVLDKVNKKGFTPFAEVEGIIEQDVKKQKKADKLVAELGNALSTSVDLESLAASVNTRVQSASNIRFTSYSIPNVGVEPKVIAAATNLKEGVLSKPIDGTNGVFVISVNTVEENQSLPGNYEKTALERSYSSKLYSGLTETLEELAKVEDNRINFF